MMQRPSIKNLRRNNRQFRCCQFLAEGMLFQNGGIRPALCPVELDDLRRTFFHEHLIDPVLITVQCQQTSIRPQADPLQRVEQGIRRQCGKRCFGTGRIGGTWHAISQAANRDAQDTPEQSDAQIR